MADVAPVSDVKPNPPLGVAPTVGFDVGPYYLRDLGENRPVSADDIAYEAAANLKVCRTCTTVAFVHQERCGNCGVVHWGYVPKQLVGNVDVEALKDGRGPVKLKGYWSTDWPPRDRLIRTEELRSIPKRDPDSAAILASFPSILGIWGIGHIYAGKSLKGVLLLLAGASAWALFIVFMLLWHHSAVTYSFMALGIGVWGWQTMRAFNLAVERNSLRDSTWTALRTALGNKPKVSEFTPGRL